MATRPTAEIRAGLSPGKVPRLLPPEPMHDIRAHLDWLGGPPRSSSALDRRDRAAAACGAGEGRVSRPRSSSRPSPVGGARWWWPTAPRANPPAPRTRRCSLGPPPRPRRTALAAEAVGPVDVVLCVDRSATRWSRPSRAPRRTTGRRPRPGGRPDPPHTRPLCRR